MFHLKMLGIKPLNVHYKKKTFFSISQSIMQMMDNRMEHKKENIMMKTLTADLYSKMNSIHVSSSNILYLSSCLKHKLHTIDIGRR